MSDIMIICEKYRNAAAALRRSANDLGGARAGLSAAMGFAGDSWQGEASDAFLDANEWTAKGMERLRISLEDLAAEIDKAAAALEEAELKLRGTIGV
ncbi:MAG: WXG100 family type VII secretion target [Defluviitaleaceae bacterium]|nr:WXG100 family type VII secretion target [Defluviitaleaceae bacterium]